MEKPRFTMIDEDFLCEICGKKVNTLGYTARDHCPYCLHSKHVDNNPGDRTSKCHGILKPISVEKARKDRYKIVYKCEECGIEKRNVTATDDDMDLIIKIMSERNI